MNKYINPNSYYQASRRRLLQGGRQVASLLRKAGVPLDKNDRRIRALKGQFKGQRCFVLGNGPSLSITDLERLSSDVSIGANKIFLCFGETDWRPTFFNIEDDRIIAACATSINAMKGVTKILRRIEPSPWDSDEFSLLYHFTVPTEDRFPMFSWNLLDGIYSGYTVTYASLQLACYMGFSRIYLVGVDFNYPGLKYNPDGTVELPSHGAHFVTGYSAPGEKFWAPRLAENVKAFALARREAEVRGVKIFNATRGGKLEVFERVDFDSLFTTDK